MDPIPNLRHYSKLDVWICIDSPSPRKIVVMVDDDTLLGPGSERLLWDDVHETPRDALRSYLSKLQRQLAQIQDQISATETKLKRDYPVNTKLSERAFKQKYPNVPLHYRDEDCSPDELARLQNEYHWREHRYDSAG